MACRIRKIAFLDMVDAEARALGLNEWALDPTDPDHSDVFDGLFELDGITVTLNRKAIQSLVDEAEQARPIIRNLLRWAKEHGAK